MAHGVERHVLALGSLEDPGECLSACRWIPRHVFFLSRRWEQPYRIHRFPILREHFEYRRREDDASFRCLGLGWIDYQLSFHVSHLLSDREFSSFEVDILPLQTNYLTVSQTCGKVEHKHFVESFDLSLVQELLHRFGREYLDLWSFLWWQLTSDGRVLTDELFRHCFFKCSSAMSVDASDNRIGKSGAVDISSDKSAV